MSVETTVTDGIIHLDSDHTTLPVLRLAKNMHLLFFLIFRLKSNTELDRSFLNLVKVPHLVMIDYVFETLINTWS